MTKVFSVSALPTLRHQFLVEGLLPAGLLFLYTGILVGEFVTIVGALHLFEQCTLPLLTRQPSAVELGWASDDLANVRELRCIGSKSLLLVFGVQQASHANKLPIPLEFGRELGFGDVEP